jgi:hypothetical protein
MGFTYSVKLPGYNKLVWAKEINSKDYRDLVKSLYNNDSSSFIQHSNYVVEQIVPGILQEGLNVVDKLILLVNARAVSVNPDLKVNAVCKETEKEFQHTIKLDTIFDRLSEIQYNNITTYKNIEVAHSIVKAKDEKYFLTDNAEILYVYQLASSVDQIIIKDKVLKFNEISFEERCKLIENLPADINNKIIKKLYDTELALGRNKLLYIESPYSKIPAVDIPLSTDIAILLHVNKVLFTDDLNNFYKLVYNLISKLNFQGDYLDRLAPAELYLYWSLYLQENQQSNSEMPTTNNIGSFAGSQFNLDG